MSVLIDIRTNGTFTVGATTLSWTHTVSSGLSNSILLVAASTGKAPPHATVSGVNWDDLGTPAALAEKGTGIAESTDSVFGDLWFLTNPVAGTSKTIKITASVSCEITGSSSSYQNVDQANPFNAASPQTAIGTANPQPSLAVTSATGEMVVDAVAVNESGTSTLAQGAGQTVVGINQVGAGKHTAGSSDAPGAASVTMSWTGVTVGDLWCEIAVSLKAAATADSGAAPYQRARAGRGPGAGPSMRRMAPQQFPIPGPVDTVTPAPTPTPFRIGRAGTSGVPTRRMIPQQAPDTIPFVQDGSAVKTPFRIGRGGGIGAPTRRMFPQRYADSVGSTTALLPTEGSITIAGVAASITLIIAAVSGAITIAGNAPSISTILQGTEGSVVISGNAASATSILAPTVGAIVISGNAPSLTQTLVGVTGAVTIGGNTPSQTSILAATEGAVVIGGNAPSLVVGSGLSPTEGTIALTGNAPDLLAALSVSEGAISIGGNVPGFIIPTSASETFSGGYGEFARRFRTRAEEELRKEREQWGILPKAAQIVAAVAIRQADALGLDAEQRLEELERELELAGVRYQARYLELLNLQRQRLIDAEIRGFFEAEEALGEENKRRLMLLLAFLS